MIKKKPAGVITGGRPIAMGYRWTKHHWALPQPEVIYDAPDLSKNVQLNVNRLHSVILLLDKRSIPTA
jgi:hypothetical protein